jgi:predicted nucleic acid-binding protein
VSRAVRNRVPDALLAALAIRHDATLVTADRSFARFDGLACRYLEE